MRVAGIASKDPQLTMSYKNRIDTHSLNAKACFAIATDLEEDIAAMLELGIVKGSVDYDLELLRRELKHVKEEHGDLRTASKSVSFGEHNTPN